MSAICRQLWLIFYFYYLRMISIGKKHRNYQKSLSVSRNSEIGPKIAISALVWIAILHGLGYMEKTQAHNADHTYGLTISATRWPLGCIAVWDYSEVHKRKHTATVLIRLENQEKFSTVVICVFFFFKVIICFNFKWFF